MMTLKRFLTGLAAVPATASWSLADIGEAKGRQELFAKQSPQRLKLLKEHALIESTISSNRIEGIEVDNKRIGTIIFGNALLHDRSEEEVRGYREALNFIHEKNQQLSISEEVLKELHRLARGEIWDAGTYKEKDGDIIEKHPDGTSSIRFKTVAAARTSDYMKELIVLWIHPFRDGNGRVSRLLLLLQCYHQGIEVGRYISLERLIEQNKERYYETLKLSSEGWHEGKHDPWHYINFCCFILKSAYREFEERLDRMTRQKGEKTALVHDAIESFTGSFNVAEIQQKCPGVGIDMIRRVMKDMQTEGVIECIIRGRDAKWRKVIR